MQVGGGGEDGDEADSPLSLRTGYSGDPTRTLETLKLSGLTVLTAGGATAKATRGINQTGASHCVLVYLFHPHIHLLDFLWTVSIDLKLIPSSVSSRAGVVD